MTEDAPEPAGFGNCKVCAYLPTGPSSLCYACASKKIQPIKAGSCTVCDQTLQPGADCTNHLCQPDAVRHFEWTWAIAMKSGPLEDAIWALKRGRFGWGTIFGRVVVAALLENDLVNRHRIDMIIPTPAFLAPGESRQHHDHAGWVIEQAAEQDDSGSLPFVFDPPVILKTAETEKMRGAGLAQRRQIAKQLYAALVVPEPRLVKGMRVMVYDDVFTDGTTLNTIARKLKEVGATDVYGLSLSRQPWGT